MLPEFTIRDTIPAYHYIEEDTDSNYTIELYEKLTKENEMKTDIRTVRKFLKQCIAYNKKENSEINFICHILLDNVYLLKKVVLTLDGSWSNMKIYYNSYFDTVMYYIRWEHVLNQTAKEWQNYEPFMDKFDAITKGDIVKVMENVEHIFIQGAYSLDEVIKINK